MGAASPVVLVIVVLAVVLAAGACARGPQDKAAGEAQEACIVALEPVAQGRTPTSEQVARARRHAEAAADADQRWTPLRARLEQFDTASTPQAIDALTVECRRVNDIVRAEQD